MSNSYEAFHRHHEMHVAKKRKSGRGSVFDSQKHSIDIMHSTVQLAANDRMGSTIENTNRAHDDELLGEIKKKLPDTFDHGMFSLRDPQKKKYGHLKFSADSKGHGHHIFTLHDRLRIVHKNKLKKLKNHIDKDEPEKETQLMDHYVEEVAELFIMHHNVQEKWTGHSEEHTILKLIEKTVFHETDSKCHKIRLELKTPLYMKKIVLEIQHLHDFFGGMSGHGVIGRQKRQQHAVRHLLPENGLDSKKKGDVLTDPNDIIANALKGIAELRKEESANGKFTTYLKKKLPGAAKHSRWVMNAVLGATHIASHGATAIVHALINEYMRQAEKHEIIIPDYLKSKWKNFQNLEKIFERNLDEVWRTCRQERTLLNALDYVEKLGGDDAKLEAEHARREEVVRNIFAKLGYLPDKSKEKQELFEYLRSMATHEASGNRHYIVLIAYTTKNTFVAVEHAVDVIKKYLKKKDSYFAHINKYVKDIRKRFSDWSKLKKLNKARKQGLSEQALKDLLDPVHMLVGAALDFVEAMEQPNEKEEKFDKEAYRKKTEALQREVDNTRPPNYPSEAEIKQVGEHLVERHNKVYEGLPDTEKKRASKCRNNSTLRTSHTGKFIIAQFYTISREQKTTYNQRAAAMKRSRDGAPKYSHVLPQVVADYVARKKAESPRAPPAGAVAFGTGTIDTMGPCSSQLPRKSASTAACAYPVSRQPQTPE